MSSDTSGEVSSLSVLFSFPTSATSLEYGFQYVVLRFFYSLEFNAKYTNPFVASIALRHWECLKNKYLIRSAPGCPQELPLSSTWKMW